MSEEKRLEFEASRTARVAALREHLAAAPEAGGLPPGAVLTLEIGCGHGHFLAAYAAAHPGEYCVGVDLITKRVERSLRKRDRGGLRNLDFFKADAFEFIEAMPDAARAATIFFIHPDPWPKLRHHKNRLIQTHLLDRLAALTTPGVSRLCFRTDHAGYFEWAHEKVGAHPAWRVLEGEPWPFEQETYFSKLLPEHQSLVAERVAAAAGAA
jgi:tRNA (guanine-N7-)-methyltransferase